VELACLIKIKKGLKKRKCNKNFIFNDIEIADI